MTIGRDYQINSYVANGVLTDFAFDFQVLETKNIVVNVKDTDGNVSTKTLNTDYTATINSNGTGQISFLTAPANGYIVYIGRYVEETQEVKYETSSGFQAKVVEKCFDKLTLITQQLSDGDNRSIKISPFIEESVDTTIQEVGANKGLMWKDNGTGTLSIYATKYNPDELYENVVDNPNVITVAENIDNINTTATNITNVNNVGSNITNVNSVAGDLTNIDSVAGDLTNINSVSGHLTNVDIVATNISSVNTDATNISNINIVAQNIATIQQKVNLSGDNAVFNNLSATAKQNIALLGIPNYSSAVSISTGAVASTNGLVFALNIPLQKIGSVTTHTTAELYVNGFLAGKAYGADTIQDATSMYAIVKVGDVITFTNMAAVYFIPFY